MTLVAVLAIGVAAENANRPTNSGRLDLNQRPSPRDALIQDELKVVQWFA